MDGCAVYESCSERDCCQPCIRLRPPVSSLLASSRKNSDASKIGCLPVYLFTVAIALLPDDNPEFATVVKVINAPGSKPILLISPRSDRLLDHSRIDSQKIWRLQSRNRDQIGGRGGRHKIS
jgi:hypothetical protein